MLCSIRTALPLWLLATAPELAALPHAHAATNHGVTHKSLARIGMLEQPERLYERAGPGLSARDFGAMGDGVCTEAPDRSWTKCTGRDESAALQRAIDAAQRQARTLYVPAGVYMVNATLIIRKPNENASIAKPQPYATAGLRIVGEGMSNTIIVAQCRSFPPRPPFSLSRARSLFLCACA